MMSPQPRPEILTIAPYVGGVSQLPGHDHPLKLSSNEGAFGVPPGAQRALVEAIPLAHRYPDGSTAALRAALGRCWKLDPSRILCGAGSDDIIYQLCLAYGGAGSELIMTEHGFAIYDIAGRYAGSRIVKVPERDLTTDVDAILGAVNPRTKLVFIANPNNPTGTMIGREEVERLHRGLPASVLLVLDSAYAEYVERADYEPGIALVNGADNVVMTRTFSKIFGLGGLRLGWCFAPEPVIDVLDRVRSPFNCSVPAQAAGIAALAEPRWVEKSREHNRLWRAWLSDVLTASGFAVVPSEANFILVHCGSVQGAKSADAFLRQSGIIVRGVAGYGLPEYLRITIGLEDEVRAVAHALREWREHAL